MQKSTSFFLVLVVVSVLAAGAYSLRARDGGVTPAQPVEDIVIGYNAPLTVNSVADFGIAGRQGVEVAIDEINARGGILGHKVRGVILDDKGDKELSKKNMEQLIFQDKVLAVVGPGNSGNALYWLHLPQDNEVILLDHIATATEITQRYAGRPRNFIFRLSGLDIDQVRLLVAWALNGGKRKFAILHDTTPYGVNGTKDVGEVLARWGLAPSLIEEFAPGTSVKDMAKLIGEAKASGADVLYVYALADSVATAAKALDTVPSYNPLVLAPASVAVKQFWALAGLQGEKVHFSSPLHADYNDSTRRLNQKITERFGAPPPTFSTAAYGYDAVRLLESAIVRAGSLDHKAVRDALEETDTVDASRLYVKPFSKIDHEASSIDIVFLAHWKDGAVELLSDQTKDIEVR